MEKKFLRSLKDPDKLIYLIMLLSLIGSMVYFFVTGPATLSNSDDVGYLAGGLAFAKNGYIAVWIDAPTALIMPAMGLITGFAAKIFGDTPLYIISIRLLFILISCWTPLFFYRACAVHMPKWYALLTSLVFLFPTHLWANTLILTEAPYLLFFIMCIYYTFKMGESNEHKFLIRYCISFILALSFRANAVVMPAFTWIYLLLIRKYSLIELLRRLCILALASMILILPWTIRNYVRFQTFIPLTYGTHHPIMLGTYIGVGYPLDEELDYETNVDIPFQRDYAEYLDEAGNPKSSEYDCFLKHMRLKYVVDYRISEWMERDLGSFLYSYLIFKPLSMLNWVWYWGPGSFVEPIMGIFSKINILFCGIGFILSWLLKKRREVILFLGAMYVFNIYTISTAITTERYAAMNLPLRYIIAGIGIWLIVEAFKYLKQKKYS